MGSIWVQEVRVSTRTKAIAPRAAAAHDERAPDHGPHERDVRARRERVHLIPTTECDGAAGRARARHRGTRSPGAREAVGARLTTARVARWGAVPACDPHAGPLAQACRVIMTREPVAARLARRLGRGSDPEPAPVPRDAAGHGERSCAGAEGSRGAQHPERVRRTRWAVPAAPAGADHCVTRDKHT